MQNDLFVQCILSKGVNIFQEIRGKVKTISSRIGDQVGSKDIANKFSSIYEKLYNQHENATDLEEIRLSIERLIEAESISEADKISVDLLMKALKYMKNGKRDVFYDTQSDSLTNGSEPLLKHLTNLFKSFIVHCP